eukprot:tig00001177_g7355.t1
MAARAASPPAAVRRRHEKRVGLSLDLEPASSALLFRDWTPTKPALPERAVTGAAASVKPPEPLPPPLMQSKSAAALEESMLRSSQFFAYRRLKELQRQHGSSVAHARSAPALPQWLPKDDVLGGAAFVGYFNAPGDRTHRQLAAEAALEARDDDADLAAALAAAPAKTRRKDRHKRRRRHGGPDEPGGARRTAPPRPPRHAPELPLRAGAPSQWDSDSSSGESGGGGGGTLRSLSRTASGAEGDGAQHTTRSILSTSRSELGQLRPPDRKAFAKLYQKSRDLQTNIRTPVGGGGAGGGGGGAETTGELVAARFVNNTAREAVAVNETGALALARALLQNGTLQELDLSWNKIRAAPPPPSSRHLAAALLASLGSNEGLTSLNLAWNGLSDVEARPWPASATTRPSAPGPLLRRLRHAFAANKQANESLVELNLAANPIGPEGAKQLILAMEADAADGIERRLDLTTATSTV